jgi:5-bromo-4-chloroindolyl phosphate hydrolysis protein
MLKLRNPVQVQKASALLFYVLFLFGIFGFSALKVLILISVHYAVCTFQRNPAVGVAMAWGYSLIVLYLNNKYSGYKFADFSTTLGWMVSKR